MNQLIYFSYGKGHHVNELRFSVLSALPFLEKNPDRTGITIFTENPAPFADLPVRIELLSQEQLIAWDADIGYQHRKKIELIKHALILLKCKVIFADSDTYFKCDPRILFRRIGPGRSLMHRFEAHLDRCSASNLADYLCRHRVRRLDGSFWDIDANTFMWNSGLLGIDPSALPLLDEVLHVVDQLFLEVPLITTEQFAFAGVLASETIMSEGEDAVFHYYEDRWRTPFREHLREVFASESKGTNQQQYERLRAYLPKYGFLQALRQALGRLARRLGYTRNKLRVIEYNTSPSA